MGTLSRPPTKYGTYCGLCVYQMHGKDRVRKASSLTGKRVKEEPAFKNTMAWAGRLANASRLAGAVYDMLSPCRKRFYLYRKFTGIAMKLLTAGATEGEVVVELMQLIRLPKRKPRKKKAKHAVVKEETERVIVHHQRRQNTARRIISKRCKINWTPARFLPSS